MWINKCQFCSSSWRMEGNTHGPLSFNSIYLPLKGLKLVHMKSIHNQKLEFLHFSFFLFFAYILPIVEREYFSAMLWFDLAMLKVLKSISSNQVIFHFSFCQIFFALSYAILPIFLGIFSKILLILQLTRYCKNTTLFKCIGL